MKRLATAILATIVALGLVGTFGCAGKKKRRAERAAEQARMTPDERYAAAMGELERRNLRRAKAILQRIEVTGEARTRLEPLIRLGIADATYYNLDELSLIDARSLYLDFVTLYGAHERAPYAQLQAGICSLRQVRAPSRDQTQTEVALDDLREVLRRYPDSGYSKVAREKIREADARLATHEYLVAKFYTKRKAWNAATERLRGILRKYPDYPDQDRVFYALGYALYRGGNFDESRLYLDRLVARPDGAFAAPAEKVLRSLERDERDADARPKIEIGVAEPEASTS